MSNNCDLVLHAKKRLRLSLFYQEAHMMKFKCFTCATQNTVRETGSLRLRIKNIMNLSLYYQEPNVI